MTDCGCKEAKARVFDYLADELEKESKHEVDQHLARCEACQADYEIEKKISKLISISSQNLSMNFSSRIQSRLQSEK